MYDDLQSVYEQMGRAGNKMTSVIVNEREASKCRIAWLPPSKVAASRNCERRIS